MKEYEIIGKDVYGTQAVTKNNITNCSNCRYKEFTCGTIPCKDFFYLKDEELEKINNEKIQILESRIKELEATIENMKSIAINLQQPEQVRTTTSVDYQENKIKRFESGTNELEVFKYLIKNKVKVMRYNGDILTVINITELGSYPILMSSYEKYSKNGFFKNFTNIDGSDFYLD